MSQEFGISVPHQRTSLPQRQAVKYLMVMDIGGTKVARLFLESLELVNEFDAAVNEVVELIAGRLASSVDKDPLWANALRGLSADEQASAMVYTLA